jgi:dipeptide transport system substrate-binding protein
MEYIKKLFISLILISDCYAATLKVCLESPIYEFDIHKATDTSSVEVLHKKVYESLIKYYPKKKSYYSLIAKSIEFPSANKVLIKLKKEISFHSNKYFKPRRYLNADDLVFSFSRQMLKNAKNIKEESDFVNFRNRNLDNIILNIKKVDSHTVLITTKNKLINIYELLSEHFLAIMSKEYYAKLKKRKKISYFSDFPIGTGPFSFIKKKSNIQVNLKRFEKYHGNKPKVEKLNFYLVSNNKKRTNYALSEKCHITHNPSWSSIRDIEKNKNLTILPSIENNMLYMTFNTKTGPFKNKVLRKVVAQSLSIDKYLREEFYGHAKRANHILSPNFKEYSTDYSPNEKNILLAKKTIKKLYPYKQLVLNLWTITVARPYCPDGIALAEKVKIDLAKVGIKVNIIKKPFDQFLKKTSKGEHDFAILGKANLTDQEEVLKGLTCQAIKNGSNRARWCNKEYDKLVTNYFKTKNPIARKLIMQKISLIFNSELPRLMMGYMPKNKVISSKIINYNFTNDSAGDYTNIIFLNDVIKSLKRK